MSTDTGNPHHAHPKLQVVIEAYGGKEDFFGIPSQSWITTNTDLHRFSEQEGEGFTKTQMEPYGEIHPVGLFRVLRALKVKPGDHFVDLGSGTGKLAVLAWRLYNMHSTGIELVEGRHQAGCAALERLDRFRNLLRKHSGGEEGLQPEAGGVRLVYGSFFDFNINNNNVVFVDNLVWRDDKNKKVLGFLEGLPKGTKIASGIKLENEDMFHEIKSVNVPVSWGEAGRQVPMYLYRKLGDGSEADGSKPRPSDAVQKCVSH